MECNKGLDMFEFHFSGILPETNLEVDNHRYFHGECQLD